MIRGCGFTFIGDGFVTIPALAIIYRNFDMLRGILQLMNFS